MLYEDIQFPAVKNKPYFYTNLVSTIDGKVMVKTCPRGYWPIGSATDFQVVQELRAHADVLLHGKKTAMWYRVLDTINRPAFQKKRLALGKPGKLPYVIVTNTPELSLVDYLENARGNMPFLVTHQNAAIPTGLHELVRLVRFGEEAIDLSLLAQFLFSQGFQNILIEGEPQLLGNFLKEDLLDEIFLTVAPKLFGNEKGSTMTMIEGGLLPHTKIKRCQILSVEQVDNELFLRYKIAH